MLASQATRMCIASKSLGEELTMAKKEETSFSHFSFGMLAVLNFL
jgi:hypothetical protein